jgi:hypothetical protein
MTGGLMPALSNGRWESFAQKLAAGLPPVPAARACGYAPEHVGRALRLAAKPIVAARTAEIVRERALAASDLMPVIDRLMALAEAAAGLNSAAGMTAAMRLLAEAARLKTLLPRPETFVPIEPGLSEAAWLASFAGGQT